MAAGSAMDDGALSELGDGSSEPASAIYNTNQKGPSTLRERERRSDVASRWVPKKSNLLFTSISNIVIDQRTN